MKKGERRVFDAKQWKFPNENVKIVSLIVLLKPLFCFVCDICVRVKQAELIQEVSRILNKNEF